MKERTLTEIPKRYPVDGTFELTVRCNLHCKMCLFRHDDSENGELKKKELSTEQWISLGKQAAEEGTLHLLITGGEPMQTATFCGQQGRIFRTVRAILNGQPGISAGQRVVRPTDQY